MFDTCILASTIKHATVKTMLKSEHVTLKFQNLGDDDSLKLVIFSDASMGNLPDGGTQGGHLIVVMGKEGIFSPVCCIRRGSGEWFGVHWQEKHLLLLMGSTMPYFSHPSTLNSPQEMSQQASCR